MAWSTAFTEMFGVRYPIASAPMGGSAGGWTSYFFSVPLPRYLASAAMLLKVCGVRSTSRNVALAGDSMKYCRALLDSCTFSNMAAEAK